MIEFRFCKVLCSIIATWLVVACASTFNDGTKALESQNWALAEQLLLKAIRDGDDVPKSWNNLGYVYMSTGRRDLGIRSYTMAARYGLAQSQANLVSLNQPVPSPDLANSRAGSSGAEALTNILGAGIDGYNQGRAAGAAAPQQVYKAPESPPRVTCNTTQTGPGTATTDCKQR